MSPTGSPDYPTSLPIRDIHICRVYINIFPCFSRSGTNLHKQFLRIYTGTFCEGIQVANGGWLKICSKVVRGFESLPSHFFRFVLLSSKNAQSLSRFASLEPRMSFLTHFIRSKIHARSSNCFSVLEPRIFSLRLEKKLEDVVERVSLF